MYLYGRVWGQNEIKSKIFLKVLSVLSYGCMCVLFVKMRQSSSYLGGRLVFRVQEERQSLSRLRRYQLGSRLIFGVQERCLSLVRRGVHVIARMHVIS